MSSTHAFARTLTRFIFGSISAGAWLRTFATLVVLVPLIPLSAAAQTINLAVSPNVLLESSPATQVSVSATIQGNAPSDDLKLSVVASGLEDTVPVDFDDVIITIPAGQTSASKVTTVTPTDDESDTPDNIITYSATHASYTVNPATLVVQDNDDPPVLVNAEVDGPELTMTYDKELATTPTPQACQYTVLVGSAEPVVKVSGIVGQKVTLTLDPAIRNGESLTVSYINSADGSDNNDCSGQGDVVDTGGNEAQSFGTRPVANTTPIPSLTITGPKRVNGEFLTCFTFSESVDGFEVTEITVGNGSVANLRKVDNPCQDADSTPGPGPGAVALLAEIGQYFTARVTPGESGAVTVDVPAGVATSERSGTPNSAAGRYTASIDKVKPTVSISGPSGRIRSDFTVTFIFSEDIVGFEFDPEDQCASDGDVCIEGGSMHAFEKVSARRFTGRITPEEEDDDESTADLTITVNEGAVEDLAGNENEEVEREWHVDKDELTVRISAPGGTQDDGEFDVRFRFSSTVSGGLQNSDVAIEPDTAGEIEEIVGSGGSWTVTISPLEESFTVNLTGSGTDSKVTDEAGDAYPLPDDVSITAKVGPTVRISPPSSVITDEEVSGEVTFKFEEEVTGFSRSDISVENGTVVSGPTDDPKGDSTLYLTRIKPASDGDVKVWVRANRVRSKVGSVGNKRSSVEMFTADVGPTVSITSTSSTVAGPFAVTITFDEDTAGGICTSGCSEGGEFVKDDITVTNGTVTRLDASFNPIFTATITPQSTGTTTLMIDEEKVKDDRGNWNRKSNTLSVTVNVDDPTGISLSASPRRVSEGDGPTVVTITASVNNNAVYDETVVVTVSVDDSNQDGVVGFQPVSDFTVVIQAGQDEGEATFTITPTDDNEHTADERVSISGTLNIDDTVSPTSITLEDDDESPGGVVLSVNPATISEASPNTEVVVTATVVGGRSYPEDEVVSVTAAGTQGAGAVDFEVIPPFVIPIDADEEEASTTITILPINDQVDEINEVIRFTGELIDNEDPVTSAELTLTDDDAAPTGITVSLSPTSVDESAGETTVTVTATAGGSTYGTDQTIAVTVTGTLVDGAVDFEPIEPFELILPAETQTASTTFKLNPQNDNADETNETITVTGTYGTPPATSSASLTIVDDDATPTDITLTADPATISEEDGETTITVKATVGGSTTFGKDEPIDIQVSGSGIPGTVDFAPVASFVLTIPAEMASAEATFMLDPEDDNSDEADETVIIEGTGPTGEISATVVITDNDETPAGITLSAVPSEVPENATLMTITVEATVSGSTTYGLDQVLNVNVDPSGQDGVVGFQPVQDFSLTVPAGEMSASRTFGLRPINNNADEENEIVYISAMHQEDEIVTTVLITDDDDPPTGITLLASPSSVAENSGPTQISVVAQVDGGTTFGTERALAITVTGTGNPGVVGFSNVPAFKLTIPAREATASAVFTLTPENNVIDEANETVTILGTVDTFTPSTSVTLIDDDAPPSGITLSPDPTEVKEDAGATTVTVTASVQGGTTYALGQNIPVNVSGSGTAGVVRFAAVPGFEIFVEPGSPTGTATFTITPEDNVVDEADETVMISGTHLAREVATSMRLVDDDEPPTGVSLAANPETIDEGGGTATITVTATVEGGTTYAFEQSLDVNVGTSGGTDVVAFEPVPAFTMTVPAGLASATATFNITPVDNRKRETDETVSIRTSHLGTTPSATVTIVDNDAPLARYTEVTSVILPELTRAMTASTVGAVASRISKAGMGGADAMALSVGGHSTLESVLSEYRTRRSLGGVSWQERVGASSFTVSPAVANGLAGRLTFWGQGDYTSLGGGGLGVVDWDGSVTGMHIGTDADMGSGVLIGLAVSRTGGSADYTYTGANQVAAGSTINGTYGASMQSVHPYASWSFVPDSYIWASAGVGAGSVEIVDDESEEQTSDSRMITAVIGATMRVLRSGGISLDVKSEAWQSSVEVDDNGANIEGSTVNVNRIRVGVETALGRRLASGAMMTPFVELGIRNDGGDGQTGFGFELGGGLRFTTLSGLSAEGRGRALLAHKGDVQEWGFSGTIVYSPGAGREGLSLELGSTAGSAASGLQRLWSDEMMVPEMLDTEPRVHTEIGYGMGMYNGILRPFGAVEMSETHGMRTSLGTEYRIGPRFNVGVQVEHVALPGAESRSPMVRGKVTLR